MKKFFNCFKYLVLVLSLVLLVACGKEEPKVAEITFDNSDITLKVDEAKLIEYTVVNAKGSAKYESSDTSVATVNNGLVYGVKEGTVNIKVTITCDDAAQTKKEYTVKVNVNETRTVDITLDADGATVEKNKITVKYNTTVTLPQASKEGYEFLGWSLVKGEKPYISELNNVVNNTTVYANFKLNTHKISYNLNGGTVDGTNPTEFDELTEVTLLPATQYGYTFLGWYDGDAKYEKIEVGTKTDLQLKAKWQAIVWNITYVLDGGTNSIENPATYTIDDWIELTDATKEGAIFKGWFVNDEKVTDFSTLMGDVTITAQWKYGPETFEVGAGKTYTTIASALEVATLGDIIVISAGTYDESLEISTNYLTFKGANAGISYDGTRGEETILTDTFTVTANGVTIDGIKFINDGKVSMTGDNNSILNCISDKVETLDSFGSNRIAPIGVDGESKNFTVKNTYINVYFVSGTNTAALLSNYTVDTILVENCKFENNITALDNSDGIRFNNIAGTILIKDCVFNYGTDDFDILLGDGSNACILVQIIDNEYNNNSLGVHGSGLAVRYGDENCVVEFIGNVLNNIGGNLIDTKYSKCQSIIKYNEFNSVFKYTQKPGEGGSVTYENNYYGNGFYTADHYTTDKDVVASKEALQALYDAYKNQLPA